MCCRHVGFVGVSAGFFWFVGFCSVLAYVSAPVSDMYGCSNVDCASVCSLRMCRQSMRLCVLLSSAAYIIIKNSQICT